MFHRSFLPVLFQFSFFYNERCFTSLNFEKEFPFNDYIPRKVKISFFPFNLERIEKVRVFDITTDITLEKREIQGLTLGFFPSATLRRKVIFSLDNFRSLSGNIFVVQFNFDNYRKYTSEMFYCTKEDNENEGRIVPFYCINDMKIHNVFLEDQKDNIMKILVDPYIYLDQSFYPGEKDITNLFHEVKSLLIFEFEKKIKKP